MNKYKELICSVRFRVVCNQCKKDLDFQDRKFEILSLRGNGYYYCESCAQQKKEG